MRWLALVYALLAAGLVYAIARVAYPMRADGGRIFEQARYVMPLDLALRPRPRAGPFSWLRGRAATWVVGGSSRGRARCNCCGRSSCTVGRYYL